MASLGMAPEHAESGARQTSTPVLDPPLTRYVTLGRVPFDLCQSPFPLGNVELGWGLTEVLRAKCSARWQAQIWLLVLWLS